MPECAARLLHGKKLLVFGKVDGLPVAAFDGFADLCRGLALTGLFVGVESFADASSATGAVLAGETIEQAAVTLAAVTEAIAGLLVESFLGARGRGVGVFDHGIGEDVRAHGWRKKAVGRLRMIRRHGVGAGILWRTQGGTLRHKGYCEREDGENCAEKNFVERTH